MMMMMTMMLRFVIAVPGKAQAFAVYIYIYICVSVCVCKYLRTVVAYLSPSAGRAVHNHNGHGHRSSSYTGHGLVRGGLTRATCGSDHDQMLVFVLKNGGIMGM